MSYFSRHGVVLLCCLALCLPALASAHAQTPASNTEWAHRRAITVTNPSVAELRDFQVKVELDATNFDFDLAQPDGGDLRFTDQSGTKYIAHWVERYDAAAKQATIWVKAPHLPASGAQTLYAYYGNAQAEDLSSGRRAFEMFDDFGQPGLGYYAFGEPTTIMTRTLAWETQAPHTLSVVEFNRDGYKYWGYYGLADCGGIGVARSNDLVTWDKLPEPLLNKDGERWPSTLKVGEAIYMIYDRDHCGVSHLVLRTSKDGLTFDPEYTTIVALEQGVRNQNPALFQDPNTDRFHLYWYRGGAEAGFWQIKMRSADTVEGLADPASERVLLDVPYELAAPNMMFRDGLYFLSTEVNENAWKTRIYAGTSPEGPFAPLPDAPQLSDNQACLFQHPIGEVMHGYICKIVGADWVLNHRAANLGNGRLAQRVLDTGVWAPMQGEWQPVESDQIHGRGIVLRGRGQRAVVRTALPGQDHVFEALGQLRNGDAWGVAVRVQDLDNYYRVMLQRDGRVRIEKVSGGKASLLAESALNDFDANVWHTLTVNTFGNHIEALVDGQPAAKAIDLSSAFASGNSALIAGAGDAEFDDVRWRKYAPQAPTINAGPREDRISAQGALGAWFSMAHPAPVFAPLAEADTPAITPHPLVNTPWLVGMAVLMTVIALGIMVVGLARSRIQG